jgi:hypothetical protein
MASRQPDDGTRQLVQTGIWTLGAGVLAALLTSTVFGGIGPQGPHTSTGWIFLLIAMGCLPFGSMALLLGGAKWLRNWRLAGPHPSVTELPLKAVSSDPKTLLSFSESPTERHSHGKKC